MGPLWANDENDKHDWTERGSESDEDDKNDRHHENDGACGLAGENRRVLQGGKERKRFGSE